MSMKFAKGLVDEFDTRVFQDGELTFGEVRRKGKVLATLAQDSDQHKMFSWRGKAHNRQGKLKERDRSTSWNSLCTIDFKVELERGLYRAISNAFREEADSMF
jgi:hypothetical protein